MLWCCPGCSPARALAEYRGHQACQVTVHTAYRSHNSKALASAGALCYQKEFPWAVPSQAGLGMMPQ